MNNNYVSVKCALRECAFPYRTCNQCEYNVTHMLWPNRVLSNPHGHYQWLRGFNPYICLKK